MWFTDGLVSLLEQAGQQSEQSGTVLDYNLVFEVSSLIIILVLAVIARGRFSGSYHQRRAQVNARLVRNLSDLFIEYLRQSGLGDKGQASPSETVNGTAGIARDNGTSKIEDEFKQ